MIVLTVLLVMFCVVLAFVLVGIDPSDNLPEVRRKMARLFRRRDERTDWFIETMRRYDDVLRMAMAVLKKRGMKDVDSVDEVRLIRGNEVMIDFTFKWDWEYLKDSVTVPVDEFIGC